MPGTAVCLAEEIVVSLGLGVRKPGWVFQLLLLLAVWASFLTVLHLYFLLCKITIATSLLSL